MARKHSRRCEQEEPDDGRDLAQRERVLLAPEVDVDDLELGGQERDRHDRHGTEEPGGTGGWAGGRGSRRTAARARPASSALNDRHPEAAPARSAAAIAVRRRGPRDRAAIVSDTVRRARGRPARCVAMRGTLRDGAVRHHGPEVPSEQVDAARQRESPAGVGGTLGRPQAVVRDRCYPIRPMTRPRTLVDKIWDDHVVPEEPGAPASSRRPPPRPRGDLPPGVHRSAIAVSGSGDPTDRRDDRPLNPNDAPRPPDGRHAGGGADQAARDATARARDPDPRPRPRHPRDRPRHRPGAGADLAGDDDRVRRRHTATHGAFGALAFGIGTSEVEHGPRDADLLQRKPRTIEVRVDGRLNSASAPRTSSSR